MLIFSSIVSRLERFYIQYRSDARYNAHACVTRSHAKANAFTRARAYAFVRSSACAKVESDAQCMKYNAA